MSVMLSSGLRDENARVCDSCWSQLSNLKIDENKTKSAVLIQSVVRRHQQQTFMLRLHSLASLVQRRLRNNRHDSGDRSSTSTPVNHHHPRQQQQFDSTSSIGEATHEFPSPRSRPRPDVEAPSQPLSGDGSVELELVAALANDESEDQSLSRVEGSPEPEEEPAEARRAEQMRRLLQARSREKHLQPSAQMPEGKGNLLDYELARDGDLHESPKRRNKDRAKIGSKDRKSKYKGKDKDGGLSLPIPLLPLQLPNLDLGSLLGAIGLGTEQDDGNSFQQASYRGEGTLPSQTGSAAITSSKARGPKATPEVRASLLNSIIERDRRLDMKRKMRLDLQAREIERRATQQTYWRSTGEGQGLKGSELESWIERCEIEEMTSPTLAEKSFVEHQHQHQHQYQAKGQDLSAAPSGLSLAARTGSEQGVGAVLSSQATNDNGAPRSWADGGSGSYGDEDGEEEEDEEVRELVRRATEAAKGRPVRMLALPQTQAQTQSLSQQSQSEKSSAALDPGSASSPRRRQLRRPEGQAQPQSFSLIEPQPQPTTPGARRNDSGRGAEGPSLSALFSEYSPAASDMQGPAQPAQKFRPVAASAFTGKGLLDMFATVLSPVKVPSPQPEPQHQAQPQTQPQPQQQPQTQLPEQAQSQTVPPPPHQPTNRSQSQFQPLIPH